MPEVKGTVTEIEADLSHDAKSGQAFYVARLKQDAGVMTRLGGLKFVPGISVEAFIGSDERTALSYLPKPFMDQLNRAR
jgi:HlyD family secretion protein